MRDITKKHYIQKNDLWGLPQTYRDTSFYPIKLKDAESITLYHKIFQFPKDFIPEKQVLKSSYLKYLILYIDSQLKNETGESLKENLEKFLKIITKKESVSINFQASPNINKVDAKNVHEEISVQLIIGDKKLF